MTFTRSVLFNRHRLSHQQIDDFLLEKESKNYVEEKVRNMMMFSEFLHITQLFESAQLEYISLKGPLLSYRLYGDATYRRCNDLDFLMSLESVTKAVQILKKEGYKPVFYEWPDNKNRLRVVSNHTNQFFLHHPDKKTSIELHWKLFKYRIVKKELLTELVTRNTTQMIFQGRSFTVFNNEFEFIYLVIHGGLHAWRRFKWLVDISVFLEKIEIKHEKYQKLVDILNAGRMISLCNSLLIRYFPDCQIEFEKEECPTSLIRFAISQLSQEKDIEYDSMRSFKNYISYKMKAFPGINYKLSVLKQFMFSIEDVGNNRLPSNAFIFYAYRPFGKLNRWILGKIKK